MRSQLQKATMWLGGLLGAAIFAIGCGGAPSMDENPFTDETLNSEKEDTGYLNKAGTECHVRLEADIQAPEYQLLDSPPYLAQFAVTYLRKHNEFYLQLLMEDETAPEQVEWLVDGKWISAEQAKSTPSAKLTHFRFPQVNAVVLNKTYTQVKAGTVFKATVPVKPYSVMADGGKNCAEEDDHIGLSQDVYWYLWEPAKSGCKVQTQVINVTVTELLPKNPTSYPEYDMLWADKVLSVVVVFGKLDDGDDLKNDSNWYNADEFVSWLTGAGFKETPNAPMGKRYEKTVGTKKEVVDVFYPGLFDNVADYAHLSNWRKAVAEHEVVIYLGHSVLGTGMAYSDITYPDFYQIFLVGGCLGYEYYVKPILDGKGDWSKVDVLSSIVENLYSEMTPAAGAFLAKLFYGYEHSGRASWQVIMGAINNKLGHSHFGVSGARGNCFSPYGSKCK